MDFRTSDYRPIISYPQIPLIGVYSLRFNKLCSAPGKVGTQSRSLVREVSKYTMKPQRPCYNLKALALCFISSAVTLRMFWRWEGNEDEVGAFSTDILRVCSIEEQYQHSNDSFP